MKDFINNPVFWISTLITLITTFLGVYQFISKIDFAKHTKKNEEIIDDIFLKLDKNKFKITNELNKSTDEYNKDTKSDEQIPIQSEYSYDEFSEEINNLIKNHHIQALNQSKIQFGFSLGASVVGFIIIIICLFIIKSDYWYEYILKFIPGAIIESVSYLFFSQSKVTREKASDFLNRLREDRQYEKSILIAESIEDDDLSALLKCEIALKLSGINEINIFEQYKTNSFQNK